MNKELQGKELLNSIKMLIEQSKQQVAVAVNAAMSMLYWQIGKRINEELKGKSEKKLMEKRLSLHCGDNCQKSTVRHFPRKI